MVSGIKTLQFPTLSLPIVSIYDGCSDAFAVLRSLDKTVIRGRGRRVRRQSASKTPSQSTHTNWWYYRWGHNEQAREWNRKVRRESPSDRTLLAYFHWRAALGRATWKLLWVLSSLKLFDGEMAYLRDCKGIPWLCDILRFVLHRRYETGLKPNPKHPTADEREALNSYFHLSARLYPCGECAAEFQALLQKFPPQVSYTPTLWQYFTYWTFNRPRPGDPLHSGTCFDLKSLFFLFTSNYHRLCALHNEVNKRLEKPEFDCSHLTNEYDCGCGDSPPEGNPSSPANSDLMDLEVDSVKDELTDMEMIPGADRWWVYIYLNTIYCSQFRQDRI